MRKGRKVWDSDADSKDIIALDKDSDAVVQVFFVRSGKLIGREHFYMTHVEDSDKAQILLDFVKQFYAGTHNSAGIDFTERNR